MTLSAIVPLSAANNEDTEAAAFLPFAGESALSRIARALLTAVPEPGLVVVAAGEPLVNRARESLASHGLSAVRLVTVAGAADRVQCLSEALAHLRRESPETAYVLVHDVSRPLVSADVLERVIGALGDEIAVVMPALPVTDSVKAVDASGSVTRTLDRSTLSAVQYPIGFATSALTDLISRCGAAHFDELEEAVRAGVPITMVDGDPDGFPAELPRDTPFLEAVIASRTDPPVS